MSNKNLSIIFTGQGSQFPEMGIELASKYSWVQKRYQQSSDILGYDVLKMQENPDLLNLTEYSQPAIFIYTSILIDFVRDKIKTSGSNITLAGHSLGEYAALYFANSLIFEDMLKVVKFRGEAMSIVSDPSKYMMYAILKKEDQIIDNSIFGNGVYLANLNSDKQVVICGLRDELESFKEKNALGKYIPLNVSAPFHSELMIESSNLFKNKISDILFNDVEIDVISNHMLINYKNISKSEYSNQLKVQIHSPVMWSDTIQKIISMNVYNFIEIGPKKTLLNFIPRSFTGEKIAITNNEEIENYV
jgi:malonyl CoA-acyl carrier protein transacylase|tara:strand:- start:1842 stop:2753 length:912 start_codon:yes stop_codon:yes gene_type:complete